MLRFLWKHKLFFILIYFSLCFFNCGNRKDTDLFDTKPVSIKFYNFAPGGDSTVSAADGGNGFSGKGWVTNTNYPVINNKNAVKGGRFIFPVHALNLVLRSYGKDSNFELNAIINSLTHESLLNLNQTDNSLIPCLATHWKTEDDSLTFLFRINPDARWADGMPVSSDDFIATYKLLKDSTILDPYINFLADTYEPPVRISKYIFSIKSKIKSWRQLVYISTLPILPAHVLKDLNGKNYMEIYQNKYLIGSGPYLIFDDDVKKDESITLRRRSDYWGNGGINNAGKYNFDEIKFILILDKTFEFEKFKKGDIDLIQISDFSIWNTGFNFDYAGRNVVIRKKIYNKTPLGYSGIILNTKKFPFDDIKVRKAFIHLFNRKLLNEKLFYGQYSLYNSYFPNSEYSNPADPVLGYNYDSSLFLLNQAGWHLNKSKNSLEKNNSKLEVTIPFVKPMDRYLTIYQEDLEKAGIRLNLKEIDYPTLTAIGNEKNFTMIPVSWSGTRFPNPESFLSSESSNKAYTNNWSGISDPGIDSLCKLYNTAYQKSRQIEIIKKIDEIAYNSFALIDGFYSPFKMLAYQNKFGYPEEITTNYNELLSIFQYWYLDPEKSRLYIKAKTDRNMVLQPEEIEVNNRKKN